MHHKLQYNFSKQHLKYSNNWRKHLTKDATFFTAYYPIL